VKIIEVDAERRRLSLSLKRVEDGEVLQPLPEGVPALDLSEEVFAERPALEADEAENGAEPDQLDVRGDAEAESEREPAEASQTEE
jgi:hypothetical protein